MGIYLTGDTHGGFSRVSSFTKKASTSRDDVMIVLGDAGINYFDPYDPRTITLKRSLSKLQVTLLCIHGNHEARPCHLDGYIRREWNGGHIFVEPKYPNILFAEDASIFILEGKRFFVCGGAYSVDKWYRLRCGAYWFEDEQPDDRIKARCVETLAASGWETDYVLTHTCPAKYIPTEAYIGGADFGEVDRSTEEWFDGIESRLRYDKWYCGHWHCNKSIDKMRFMYEDVIRIGGDPTICHPDQS